jgi:putative ABC transport system ATP-binding protein
MMIVELKSVFKDYMQGKMVVPVLKDINMQIQEGEYLAVMGPSGSGKTTLMNILGCLDTPTSGEYILQGRVIAGLDDAQMAKIRNQSIGFVFQTFNLLPRQTAWENVTLPLIYGSVSRKDRKEIAANALKKVGLEDRLDFKPTQLSGGQCQRVAIARAICTNPKLLLADEPTGALDSASGQQVMDIFSELHQEGATIIVITHEKEVAKRAQNVVHILDGMLKAEERSQ